MNLVFLGPPGSGKGTQATRLAAAKGLFHLSTGAMLRDAVEKGTPLGRQASAYMAKGELVPDTVIIGLIEDMIGNGSLAHGFILDGFPRNIPQAESLRDMLTRNRVTLDRAILFVVPDTELVKRLSGRWTCPTCGAGYNYPTAVPKVNGKCDREGTALQRREDDKEEVVRTRLDVYKKQTQPIEQFYRNAALLTEIDGHQSPDMVFAELTKIADSVGAL